MIERVYSQVAACNEVNEIFVATDDERIVRSVSDFGGKVVLTSETCLTGTDRCAEALSGIPFSPDLVLNVQGDEPFIQPGQLSELIYCMQDTSADVGTLVKRITKEEDVRNPNVVKVAFSSEGKALYFSRSAIPFNRSTGNQSMGGTAYFRHIGIYAFRAEILPALASLPPGKLEIAESLEQLRWLEAGYTISTAITEFESIGIDTPEDLEAAGKWLESGS